MNIQTRIFLTVVCLLHTLSLAAQQPSIRGIVKDKTTGSPVAGAAVYVNNSTYTRICDAAGAFVFDKYPALPFDLTISAVGYETGNLKITKENAGQNLRVDLQPKIVNLGEVKVNAPEKDAWAKYGKRFTEELIGYSGFAADCKILNKEVVQFRYNPDEGILNAWTEKPLQIRNNATGYTITYWLDDFELDFFTRRLFYKGYAYFNELKVSDKKAKRIEVNRAAAFKGSFCHFVRSLYKGDPLAEGFEIRVLKRMSEDKMGQYVPLSVDTLAWSDTGRLQQQLRDMYGIDSIALLTTFKALQVLHSWHQDTARKAPLRLKGAVKNEDTAVFPLYVFMKMESDNDRVVIKHYEPDRNGMDLNIGTNDPEVLTERKVLPRGIRIEGRSGNFKFPKQTMELLFTALVNPDKIVTRSVDPADVVLRIPDYLQITYIKEMEEPPYLEKWAGLLHKSVTPGPQISVISLHNKEGIHLQEDGNFYEAYDVLLEQYWSYEKLDKLMPLDYNP